MGIKGYFRYNIKISISVTLYLYLYLSIYLYVSIHIYIYLLAQLGEPRRNEIPVAINTPRSQFLVSNSPTKGIRVSWRKGDTRNRTGKIQFEPRAFSSARK